MASGGPSTSSGVVTSCPCKGKCGAKRCACTVRMDGKVVIVTGATHGLGKESSKALAFKGAKVIMAVRNTKLGEEIAEAIAKGPEASPAGSAEPSTVGEEQPASKEIIKPIVMSMDLGSMKSVRAFAAAFLEKETRLDVLMNNAGVASEELKRTEDGFESTVGINHLGPFLLTNLLLDLIKKTPGSRIVTIASVGHKYGKIDLDDYNCERRPFVHVSLLKRQYLPEYCVSKLSNVYMTTALAKRLQKDGVCCTVLHPGVVWTNILQTKNKLYYNFVNCFSRFYKTPEQGAQTQIHLACCLDVKASDPAMNGKYFVDCKTEQLRPVATDPVMEEALWKKSCELVGIEYQEYKPE